MGLQCWQNLTSATDWSGSQGMREQTSQFYNLTSRTLALTLGGEISMYIKYLLQCLMHIKR